MPNGSPRRRSEDDTALSPAEAAFVAELSRRMVDQAIDRKEVRARAARSGSGSARALGLAELVYLRLRREVGDTLSAAARRALYGKLRSSLVEDDLRAVHLGPVSVSLEEAIREVEERLVALYRIQRLVTTDPEVRGGEPVVRGTRIPVHLLADLTKQGATRDELLEDYPALDAESLDAALLYAHLHPRRGRPKESPWRADAPAETHAPGPPRES